jgi:hypothetical protein
MESVAFLFGCVSLEKKRSGELVKGGVMPIAMQLETIQQHAHGLSGGMEDYDRLLEPEGDARILLLGEATHGTHEF